ncbi:hypothetical protein LINPERPRIM_LOCUS26130 [Linum perenne]
MKSASNF